MTQFEANPDISVWHLGKMLVRNWHKRQVKASFRTFQAEDVNTQIVSCHHRELLSEQINPASVPTDEHIICPNRRTQQPFFCYLAVITDFHHILLRITASHIIIKFRLFFTILIKKYDNVKLNRFIILSSTFCNKCIVIFVMIEFKKKTKLD